MSRTMAQCSPASPRFASRRGSEKCLALEMIVQIRIASVDQLDKAGDQISGKEEESPSFVLADVDVLMQANAIKYGVVDSDDHVAKGDRSKS